MTMLRQRLLLSLSILVLAIVELSASASTALATVAWSVESVAAPTHFSSHDEENCNSANPRCDRYQLVIRNAGDQASSGAITVEDKLPPGITTTGKEEFAQRVKGEEWECTAPAEAEEKVATVKCTTEQSVRPQAYATILRIPVTAPNPTLTQPLLNEVSVSGGGATAVATRTNSTEISAARPPFEVTNFSFEASAVGEAADTQAGSHPYGVTASFDLSNVFQPGAVKGSFATTTEPVENAKTVTVELPIGLLGDPQAAVKCPAYELYEGSSGRSACPAASRVGTVAFDAEGHIYRTGEENSPTAIYNIEPEAGYPAEFAFAFAEKPIYMFASVVHTSSGYRLRVTAPGIPAAVGITGVSLTFFGDPAAVDETAGTHPAFLTNPTDCSEAEETGGMLKTKISADSWENPARWVSAESETYPQITECNLLQFDPSIELAPSPPSEGGTTQADKPTGDNFDLKIPQTSLFEERATPQLKDATVTLPEGVSVSPSAADGLQGCQETGPEGINIGSGELGPDGQDLGDPEATELGAGHAGGNGSPYDDGLYHTAPGHCPPASTLGTVEVLTPLLASPLGGHVYLAQPKCGGEGQPVCTEASATNGELYGLYLEVEASGVIVKLDGTVEANPQSGRLTAHFDGNPQLPFSELKLHLKSGPRAPLSNPPAGSPSCGTERAVTTSELVPWSSPETPTATPSSAATITGCANPMPFSPGFSAGSITPTAGAFSPFTLTFSRSDGQQNLSGIQDTNPAGLLGMLSTVPLCEEPQAREGACPAASQIGTTTVAAGAGEDPLVLGGRVYLTGSHNGAPLGLSIVVPAVAGPFNLGNVVVQAAITLDVNTAQLTAVSDPLPQSRDGVPFRLKTIQVTIDRPGFIFNPTSCAQQAVGATIDAFQGASATVSSQFAVTGCVGLPFKPSFTVSTQAKASKAGGASLDVKVAQQPGEANIHKVDVSLPLALPSRLTTLQKACTEAQFAANPAGCPEASDVGTATAVTPTLQVPLTGPAYLVSHGGAAFPDLVIVLQADERGAHLRIDLTGNTDIKNGITYSKFETVPDAPISSFELSLPEGPHSVLGTYVAVNANYSLCGQSLVMPTTIVGQNGAQVTQSTKIAVTGCGAKPSVKIKKAKLKGNAVLVTLVTSQKGTVTVSGSGLKSIRKTLGAGTHQIKAPLTKTGRIARKLRRKTQVKAAVQNSNGSSSKTMNLKL